MSLSREDRESIVAMALEKAFGGLANWVRPTLAHTFGENDLGNVSAFEEKLAKISEEVQQALASMPDEDLSLVHSELSDNFRISEKSWSAPFANKIGKLHNHKPPTIAYGFGHPSFAANFEHWARMPNLGLHEVTLVSLGAEPTSVTEDKITQIAKLQKDGKSIWSAHAALLQQREIFRRCFHFTGWGYPPEPIGTIKSWIDSLDIQVHPQFYAGLVARLSPRTDSAPVNAAKPMTTQERDTLLKLIAAMACEQYGYDPRIDRSEVTANIMNDIELIGLSMDAKTIRKWLKEASDLVDPNYWPAK